MALKIYCLKNGTPTNGSLDLYTVPSGKAAIVKNIRLVNTTGSTVAVTELKLTVGSTPAKILPPGMNIGPNTLFLDDQEITMATGDKISGYAASGGAIDFIISGVERDA